MASIAYVTDRKMIEYHRLNGNTSINFWRPTIKRKISDFEPGDFLFFLSKGTEKGRGKEKGIVGYGKFQKAQTLSFNQMWKIYETKNGYSSKEELAEAIVKITKDKMIPKSFSCLYLENVVYFQFPIYLSEFEMTISNKIESYIYIDKNDPSITNQILGKAAEFGVDLWSATLSDKQENKQSIDIDRVKFNLSEWYTLNKLEIYQGILKSQANKLKQRIIETYQDRLIPIENLKGSDYLLLAINNQQIEIIVPLVYQQKTMTNNLQAVIGHIMLFKGLAQAQVSEYEIEFSIAISDNAPLELIYLLNAAEINYHLFY